jgi:hypothetical protein
MQNEPGGPARPARRTTQVQDSSMKGPTVPADRLDTHNADVDEDAAGRGACAQIHLATGRACELKLHHAGTCEFV